MRRDNRGAEVDRHRGETVGKGGCATRSLAPKRRERGYDSGGIEAILDAVLARCVTIAEKGS